MSKETVRQAARELVRNSAMVCAKAMVGPVILNKFGLTETEKMMAELQAFRMIGENRMANVYRETEGDQVAGFIKKVGIGVDVARASYMVITDRVPLIVRKIRAK